MANLTPTPAYTGLLRALEPTDYAVPALWNDLHQVLIDQDAWLRDRILATQDGTEMGAGVITDVHLGNRTVTDTTAPASDTNTLTALVSNLANRIKAVTGAAGWRDAPATTLAAAKAHADATTGVHGATSAATPSTIIIRDAAGRAKVAAPSASDDIARKADVDAVASGIESSHIGAGGDAHALVTTTVHGFMSSTDKVKLNAYPTTVTSAATANAAMQRDASGRAKVAAPSAQDDIARKLEVDTVQSALDSHLHDTRYVRFDTAAQGLTTTQKGNARTNIDAAASAHSHTPNEIGLYTGRVNENGTALFLPAGWSVTKGSTGAYTVTHNLGTLEYTVLALAHDTIVGSIKTTATLTSWATGSFTVHITRTDTGASTDAPFGFMVAPD